MIIWFDTYEYNVRQTVRNKDVIILRRASERGHSHLNWLKSYHTFSFADYHDDAWMRFGPLRVINEDYIQPGQGFDMHPHSDMEIITYIVSGTLKHQDSMGNGSLIIPGEIQRMSAGTGVRHSEFNYSNTELLHLLQIWIFPEKKGIAPGYEQQKINKANNQLILIGSNHSSEQRVMIHQDIRLYVSFFEKGKDTAYSLNGHAAWLQLIKGRLLVNKEILEPGDGMGMREEQQLIIHCEEDAEFLLFEIMK